MTPPKFVQSIIKGQWFLGYLTNFSPVGWAAVGVAVVGAAVVGAAVVGASVVGATVGVVPTITKNI